MARKKKQAEKKEPVEQQVQQEPEEEKGPAIAPMLKNIENLEKAIGLPPMGQAFWGSFNPEQEEYIVAHMRKK